MSKMLVIFVVVGMACMIAWPVAAGTFRVELEISYDVSSTTNGATTNQANVTEMRVLNINGRPPEVPDGDLRPSWVVNRIPDPIVGKIIPEIGVSVLPGNPDPCGYVWNPITHRYYYRCW